MTELPDLVPPRRQYIVEDWKRWQQGGCLVYAVALMRFLPHLRFGTAYDAEGVQVHHFAHDDTHAYDSAGKHPLPYLGIDNTFADCKTNEDPTWYDLDPPDEDEIVAAMEHIVKHHAGRTS